MWSHRLKSTYHLVLEITILDLLQLLIYFIHIHVHIYDKGIEFQNV